MRAFEQRRRGEGERGREADIAEIEQRRMEGEAGILQQRIEPAALERRRMRRAERIGGEEHESQEGDARSCLHAERARLQRRAAVRAERRHEPRRRAPGSAPTAASSLRGFPTRR